MADVLPFSAMTDALFEQWLDQEPGRRSSHEKMLPEKRRLERARIARLFALRASAVAAELAAIADLARQLRNATGAFKRKFVPNEAVFVLNAAGLEIPHPYSLEQEYGADALVGSHAAVLKLALQLKRFLRDLDDEVRFILPTSPESVAA